MRESRLAQRLQEIRWNDPVTRQTDRLSPRQVAALVELAKTRKPFANLKAAPVSAIRDQLARLRAHLAEARTDLAKMRITAPTLASSREAEARLMMAAMDEDALESLTDAPDRLDELVRIADNALGGLPKQTVHRTDPTVIARIWSAIVGNHAEVDEKTGDLAVLRPLTLRPSYAAGSAFRAICSAVYEEITGKRDADPERAIRAFVQLQKKRRTAARS